MAIITISPNFTGTPNLHVISPGAVQDKTIVPRGTFRFTDTFAVATLAGGNQRNITITFDFPTNRHYLYKHMSFSYQADTVETTSFNTVGFATYNLEGTVGSPGMVEMFSNGPSNVGSSLVSRITWTPIPSAPRMIIDGAAGDTLVIALADMDAAAGGKVAGDIFFTVDFWMYDQEQVQQAAINTPLPVICF